MGDRYTLENGGSGGILAFGKEVFFRLSLFGAQVYGCGFVQERRWLSLGTANAVEEVPVFGLGFVQERHDCR
jgi:hypothetical protein